MPVDEDRLFSESDLHNATTTTYVDAQEMPNLDELIKIMEKIKPLPHQRILVTHPDNKTYLEGLLTELTSAKDIHVIHPYRLILNDFVEKDRWNGKWYRDNCVLPDGKFWTWFDDIDNAPDWAKYFGLVKKVMEPVFYEFDDNMNVKFNDFKMNLGAARITKSLNSKLDHYIFGGVRPLWLY